MELRMVEVRNTAMAAATSMAMAPVTAMRIKRRAAKVSGAGSARVKKADAGGCTEAWSAISVD
jgi:hypothetical protein